MPTGKPSVLRSIVESLAQAFAEALDAAEKLSDRPIRVVHVVGGGSQNRLLCQATANRSGRPVLAGPVEATALGNVLVQARALDGRTVRVLAPTDADERVSFLAEIEELYLQPSTPSAKVVFNARTGSVVLNQAVTLGACAVAHGNLSISISSTPVVSQPNALSGGQTVTTEKTDIQIKQENSGMIQIPASPQLTDVVRALNALGASPTDLLAILQAIKAAGALNAELEVI